MLQIGKYTPNPQQPQEQKPLNYVYRPDPNSGTDAFVRDILNPPFKDRQLAQQYDLATQKLGQGQQGIDIKQQNTDINQQKANILKFKAENPGLNPLATKGGNITFYNPISGKTIDSGVSTGTLTEQERLELTGEQKIDQIQTRGGVQSDLNENRDFNTSLRARTLQDLRGEQNLAQIAARVAGQK